MEHPTFQKISQLKIVINKTVGCVSWVIANNNYQFHGGTEQSVKSTQYIFVKLKILKQSY